MERGNGQKSNGRKEEMERGVRDEERRWREEKERGNE